MSDLLARYRRTLQEPLGALRTARSTLAAERTALRLAGALETDLRVAQELAQNVAQNVQNQAHKQIADIVTKALSIFDSPYTFQIHFEKKRGKTEARLAFERDGLEVDPLDGSGGGVVDVAAFALRVACLCLSKPPLRKLLVLDEPVKMLSAQYLVPFRHLLETLAVELGIQIIMVTHNDKLVSGHVVRLGED